jgi:drug/metabolite transporter (DMT)-like permease
MAIRDWLLVLGLGIIWGGSFFFNAILIRELGPLWVSAGRVSVGALGCWVFLFASGLRLPREKGLYWQLLLLGVLNFTIPFALFPLSQAHMASGVAAIINAMTPIMTVIISHFWLGGEKATPGKSTGVLFGFIGVATLTYPAVSAGGTSSVLAILGCLVATICYAISLNYARNFQHINPVVVATSALTGASLAAIPLAFIFHGTPRLVTIEGWGAMMGIGLLATTLAFLLMYPLLKRIGATNFSVVTFIAPVSAIFLGVFLLGETIELAHLLGMLAIFIGLLLIDGRLVRLMRALRT